MKRARALHNGNALAFQARVAGSIPAARFDQKTAPTGAVFLFLSKRRRIHAKATLGCGESAHIARGVTRRQRARTQDDCDTFGQKQFISDRAVSDPNKLCQSFRGKLKTVARLSNILSSVLKGALTRTDDEVVPCAPDGMVLNAGKLDTSIVPEDSLLAAPGNYG